MRGDLVSRPDRRRAEGSAGAVRRRREGTAGGQPGHLGLRRGREVPHRLLRRHARCKTRMLELVQALGEMAEPYGAWVRLHYVYPYPHVDEIIPLMAHGQGAALPGRAVPAQPSGRAAAHEAAGQRREEPGAHRSAGARRARSSWCAAPSSPASRARPKKSSSTCWTSCARRRSTAPAALPTARSTGAAANDMPGMLPQEVREERRARFMAVAEEVSAARLQRRVGATMQVLVDSAPALGRKGGVGRSLCRCAGDRRHRAAAAAGKAEQAAEGRRVHPGAHRGHRGPRPGGGADLSARRKAKGQRYAGFLYCRKQQSRRSRPYHCSRD